MQTIARRYAAALADVAVPRGETNLVQNELHAWEKLVYANEDLLEVFRNPVIPYEQKRNVLDALITRVQVSHTTGNFLRVLLHNQRLADLNEINKSIARELDERAGVVSAKVTTARPVTEATQTSLSAKLGVVTGREVRLQFAVDEALVGGIITQIGSTVYDGSVRSQLEHIKQKMIGEA